MATQCFVFKQQRIAVTPRVKGRRCNQGGARGVGGSMFYFLNWVVGRGFFSLLLFFKM